MNRTTNHPAQPGPTPRRADRRPRRRPPAGDRPAGSASAGVLLAVTAGSSAQATPVFSDWFDRGLTIVACAVLFALLAAALMSIAWLAWVLLDERRAVDYRRRTDAAMHRGTGDRTDWLAAARAEAAYAAGYLHERMRTRRPRPH